jgi:hypothetical protein
MSDLAVSIQTLAGPDAKRRKQAATDLFQVGVESCRPVLNAWLSDFALSALFLRHRSEATDPVEPLKAKVGVAVSPERFEQIHLANASPGLANVPPDQDAKEFELHFGDRIRLDVLTTKDPAGNGAIARFLAKLGEGIQQVEFEVQDVDAATKILREKFGVSPVYPATRLGAGGAHINFFLAAAPAGKKVLIELVESQGNQIPN